VTDAQGRFVAHDKHVLSMKDNNQSANLRALVDAGVRSFKIEGRYKDMGYVKNITAHYRTLLDEIIEERPDPAGARSSGRTTFTFTPDPDQNFNREFTDYFVNGRQDDIGAFDTPKNPGQPIGWVTQDRAQLVRAGGRAPRHRAAQRRRPVLLRPAEGTGGRADQPRRARPAQKGHWRVFPKDPMAGFKDLRKGTGINRNRDMDWVRTLEKKSADRRIGVWLRCRDRRRLPALTLTDEDGHDRPARRSPQPYQAGRQGRRQGRATLREQLGRWARRSSSRSTSRATCRSPGSCPPRRSTPAPRRRGRAGSRPRRRPLQRLPRATPVSRPRPTPKTR
jgi:hypothetical protein